jgi:hypothetical protein
MPPPSAAGVGVAAVAAAVAAGAFAIAGSKRREPARARADHPPPAAITPAPARKRKGTRSGSRKASAAAATASRKAASKPGAPRKASKAARKGSSTLPPPPPPPPGGSMQVGECYEPGGSMQVGDGVLRELLFTAASCLLLVLAYTGWLALGVLGLLGVAAVRVAAERRWRQHYERRDAATLMHSLRHDHEALERVLQAAGSTIPGWIQFPDVEKAMWLQNTLDTMWPSLKAGLGEAVRQGVQPQLDELLAGDALPPFIKSFITTLQILAVDFGTSAPQLTGIKSYASSRCGADDAEVTLELGTSWSTEDSKIQLSVNGNVIELKDVMIGMKAMRITLGPLIPELPCVGGLSLCFSEKPNIDFSLSTLGLDVMDLGFVHDAIVHLLKDQIAAAMVWPRAVFVPLVEDAELLTRKARAALRRGLSHAAMPRPIGVLAVTLIAAQKLQGRRAAHRVTSWFRKPSCKAKVRLRLHGRSWESSETLCTAAGPNGSFGAEFPTAGATLAYFPVYDTRVDVLEIRVDDAWTGSLLGATEAKVAGLLGDETGGAALRQPVEQWVSLEPPPSLVGNTGLLKLAQTGIAAGRAGIEFAAATIGQQQLAGGGSDESFDSAVALKLRWHPLRRPDAQSLGTTGTPRHHRASVANIAEAAPRARGVLFVSLFGAEIEDVRLGATEIPVKVRFSLGAGGGGQLLSKSNAAWGMLDAQAVSSNTAHSRTRNPKWDPPFRAQIVVDHAPRSELHVQVLRDGSIADNSLGSLKISIESMRTSVKTRVQHRLYPLGVGKLDLQLEWMDF